MHTNTPSKPYILVIKNDGETEEPIYLFRSYEKMSNSCYGEFVNGNFKISNISVSNKFQNLSYSSLLNQIASKPVLIYKTLIVLKEAAGHSIHLQTTDAYNVDVEEYLPNVIKHSTVDFGSNDTSSFLIKMGSSNNQKHISFSDQKYVIDGNIFLSISVPAKTIIELWVYPKIKFDASLGLRIAAEENDEQQPKNQSFFAKIKSIFKK